MEVIMPTSLKHGNFTRFSRHIFLSSAQKVMREPILKVLTRVLNLLNFLIGQANSQSRDILLQVLNLTTSNNREHIRGLMHDISQCNPSNPGMRTLGFGNLVEDGSYTTIDDTAVRRKGEGFSALFVVFLEFFALFLGFVAAAAK